MVGAGQAVLEGMSGHSGEVDPVSHEEVEDTGSNEEETDPASHEEDESEDEDLAQEVNPASHEEEVDPVSHEEEEDTASNEEETDPTSHVEEEDSENYEEEADLSSYITSLEEGGASQAVICDKTGQISACSAGFCMPAIYQEVPNLLVDLQTEMSVLVQQGIQVAGQRYQYMSQSTQGFIQANNGCGGVVVTETYQKVIMAFYEEECMGPSVASQAECTRQNLFLCGL